MFCAKISYNTHMELRRILILAFFVLVLIAGIAATLLIPKVEAFGPLPIEGGHPKDAVFWITFNRTMRPESVEEHLSISPNAAGIFSWEGNTLLFTPDEDWPAGTEVQVRLSTGAASSLGLPTRQELAWSFDISPILLAYLWPADGDTQIYTLNRQTGEVLQLTDGRKVSSYALGPDNRVFYYFAENNLGGSDLFMFDRFEILQDPEAAPLRLLSCQRTQCSGPAVSPDGGLLAYTRNDSQIWLLDLAGDGPPEQISPERHEAWQPLWSSTGRLSYYNFTAQQYIVLDMGTGRTTTWPNESGEPAVWALGGSALIAPEAFTVETDILRGPSGEESNQEVDDAELEPVRVVNSQLMVYQVGGAGVINLSSENMVEDLSPAFSPDGSLLAFTRRYLDENRWTPGRQIWVMVLPGTGTAPTRLDPLTNSPDFLYTGLAWHPSGTMIAAVRFNVTLLTEPSEIWLVDLSGEATRLVIGGFSPAWIP